MSTNGIDTRTMSPRELQRFARAEMKAAAKASKGASDRAGRRMTSAELDEWMNTDPIEQLGKDVAKDRAEMTPEEKAREARDQVARSQIKPPHLRIAAVDGKALPAEIPTEADLADGFVDRHGDELRYVAAWSKWLHHDGMVWRDEQTQLVRDLAKTLCSQTAGAADTRELRSIASGRTIGAVQTLAQAHRKIAATVNQWDADPWLLNTPAGMVDLRTGKVHPHHPDDHVMKITGAAPAVAADCPMWLAFLDKIFAQNGELIAYVKRLLGYSLTGATMEHAMAFFYGTGGNGKSVLLDTVAGILGDYHCTAPIETFTASSTDRHPTELARLVGARLVTSIETEQGRAWAETRIKTLTGGDRVAARFMRQEFFEFKPQFKLVIAGNHQPTLRTVDEAIKRRFNLVPFTVTIDKSERAPELATKLRKEWPAILRWMLDGCRDWQRDGLSPPAAVIDATDKYLEAQDALSAWLDEHCERGPSYRERASRLYASWKAYADRMGESAGSSTTFGPRLEAKRFRKVHTRAGNFYIGLRLQEIDV